MNLFFLYLSAPGRAVIGVTEESEERAVENPRGSAFCRLRTKVEIATAGLKGRWRANDLRHR
jgi:hypothetical protein